MGQSMIGVSGLPGLNDQNVIGGGGNPAELDYSQASNSMYLPILTTFL
jgi:hypothetical protein